MKKTAKKEIELSAEFTNNFVQLAIIVGHLNQRLAKCMQTRGFRPSDLHLIHRELNAAFVLSWYMQLNAFSKKP